MIKCVEKYFQKQYSTYILSKNKKMSVRASRRVYNHNNN